MGRSLEQFLSSSELMKPKLLLVDDQPATRKLVKTTLRDALKNYYETIDAVSVRDAIKRIEHEEQNAYGVSFIILDYKLEDGTCLPILEHIKANRYNHIKIMMLTGNDETGVLKRVLGYDNVVSIVIKPFTMNKLRSEFIAHACGGNTACEMVCSNCNI